jgi:hypothetical protein
MIPPSLNGWKRLASSQRKLIEPRDRLRAATALYLSHIQGRLNQDRLAPIFLREYRAMKESLELLTVCLRVLTAINNKQHPSQLDIDMLIAFAGARPPGIGLDEFVCDVVQSAVDMRAIARNSQTTPNGSDGTREH